MKTKQITEKEQMKAIRKEFSNASQESTETIIANASMKFPLKKG